MLEPDGRTLPCCCDSHAWSMSLGSLRTVWGSDGGSAVPHENSNSCESLTLTLIVMRTVMGALHWSVVAAV